MRRPLLTFVLTAAVLACVGWLGVEQTGLTERTRAGASTPLARPPAVPVAAAEVVRSDVPIYLTGLGTVQAFNSVLVRARVDGQIVQVDYAEGQDVHAGDVLVEIDPRPFEATLAQAQAAELKDQAQLANARLDLARANRLAATGAGTVQQQDTTRSLVAQLEAAVKADAATVAAARLQLSYCRILSPIDGRAGTRLLDVGNIVHATDATGIVRINQLHPIFVSFTLPADTLPQLRTSMKAGDVEVTAEAGDGRRLASGKLRVIDNQVNTATATILYKAVFDNNDDALWPGQFVNARVLLETKRGAITVPATAVLRGPDETYTFVIDAEHVVHKRVVKVGFSNKDIAVIEDGLASGEQVVIDGQYRIEAGTIVDPQHSAPTPASVGPVR